MTRTRWPGPTFPWSRIPCSAGRPETATTAACSAVRFAGIGASLVSRARANSAKVPFPMPNTASPGANRVTPAPTSSTVPARSMPGTGFFGARSP